MQLVNILMQYVPGPVQLIVLQATGSWVRAWERGYILGEIATWTYMDVTKC